ncbi:hypothetical protein ACKC5O_17555 [Aeromonas schubertii]|uniref:hypothetical protein n=1 Tax=Aeromonas schubertii TaxID=652 RepID=UPI0038B6298F
MKPGYALLLTFTLTVPVGAVVVDREAEQARLDAACASARQQLVDEGRSQRIALCVNEGKSQAGCEHDFARFGEREGNKRPDFSKVPACMQAEQYRKSYRR